MNNKKLLLVIYVTFLGLIGGIHGVLKLINRQIPFIMHAFWPLSVVKLSRPQVADVFIILILLGLFRWLKEAIFTYKSFGWVFGLVCVMIVVSNSFSGVRYGILTPLVGQGYVDQDYWQDQAGIYDAGDFLTHYADWQPTLGYHSRVHPPGPVLLIYGLRRVLQQPLWVEVGLFILSSMVLVIFYRWLLRLVAKKFALIGVTWLGLLPQTMIYLWLSIDGVIAMVFLATLYFWERRQDRYFFWWASVALWAASWLTFGVVWLLPVLGGMEYFREKHFSSSVKLGLVVLGYWVLVKTIGGYDYWESFQVARSFEGVRQGFYGWVDPASYVVTRIQDVLEPMLFLGPIAVWLIGRSLGAMREEYMSLVGGLAVGGLGLFLLAGAYYTGETARAAYYVIPPLILSAIIYGVKLKFTNTHWKRLLLLTLAQSMVMQSLGYWRW